MFTPVGSGKKVKSTEYLIEISGHIKGQVKDKIHRWV